MTTIKESLKQHLLQLTHVQTLWVGFSGGLDSTVLLHALAQMPELKPKLKAIHVHHGLSQNADAWLEHCQQFCQQLDIPFVAEKVQLASNKDGIEQAARDARYEAYKKHTQQGDCLLQAHHGDDQIETFMMRVTRGAGLQGLASIPKQRQLSEKITVLRPLLAVPRTMLEEYAFKQQLSWIEDESNQDSSYERNWWRNELLPRIKQHFPQRQSSFLRSIEQLQNDAALLNELLAPIVEQALQPCWWPHCANTTLDLTQLDALPEHQQPYIVRAWFNRYGLQQPSQQWLQELLRVCFASSEDAQLVMHLEQYEVRKYQQQLFLYQPPAHQIATLTIELNSEQSWHWGGAQLISTQTEQGLKAGAYQVVAAGSLQGAKLQPLGRPRKTLKALFQEHKIPAVLREHWPALVQNNELCALAGLEVAEHCWGEAGSKTAAYGLSWRANNSTL